MSFDFAIDIGTSAVRILVPDKGIIVNEPSVVTVSRTDDSIIAIGQEAYQMLGRTSGKYQALYPIQDGVISDMGLAEAMIASFLKKFVTSKIGLPRAAACIPGNITEVEKRAVISAVTGAGVRRVGLIEAPLAAALGAGLELTVPHGSMIVDIGGGTIDLAVVTLNGIAVSRSVKQAGNHIDEEIIKYIREKYHLLIGKRTAEETKKAIGNLTQDSSAKKYRVKGRSMLTGLPAYADLISEEIKEPIEECVQKMIDLIQDLLEETSPELIGDIDTDGLLLSGGSANLPGLKEKIEQEIGLKVRIADEPELCVVKGCGKALKYLNRSTENQYGISPFIN